MKPVIIRSAAQMQSTALEIKGKIGFVPTMGYLHEGHLSLVREAKKRADLVIVSIYVNPAQFAPNEDLSTYPRNFERDLDLLGALEVDYVFFPSDEELYPPGYKTWVNVEELTSVLCGKSRPEHFRGVTTIVAKLINIINADFIFLGEKDYQQLIVLKKMIEDLHFKTKIIGCPLIREPDGLAMSSRNKHLSLEQRKQALSLHRSLQLAAEMFNTGSDDADLIRSKMSRLLLNSGVEIDYIEAVDPVSLQSVDKLFKGCRMLLAAFVGKTRLIDNMEI